MVMHVRSLTTQCFRRHPGKPSYHRVASNCWQLGWATNWEKKRTSQASGTAGRKSTFIIALLVYSQLMAPSQRRPDFQGPTGGSNLRANSTCQARRVRVNDLFPTLNKIKSTNIYLPSVNCCCLVVQSCLTLCDPMEYSMPDFSVLHPV